MKTISFRFENHLVSFRYFRNSDTSISFRFVSISFRFDRNDIFRNLDVVSLLHVQNNTELELVALTH
jgi:hypothetical protein